MENNDIVMNDDFVLLKRKQMEEKTSGGLFVPQTSQEKSSLAQVIAVGPGRLNLDGSRTNLLFKPGDSVVVDRIGGFEIDVEGEKFLVVRAAEIICSVKVKQ